MDLGAEGYGVLLGSLGVGAVIGAIVLPRLRQALTPDRLIDLTSLVFAAVLTTLGFVPPFYAACLVLLACGLSWMAPLSSLNVETQTVAPTWVRARALALHLLVLQGGLAFGAAAWGWTADRIGTPLALQVAAGGLVLVVVITQAVRLRPIDHLDHTPAVRWPAQEVMDAVGHDDGPVLVTVEYQIDPARTDEFLQTMRIVRRMRRRSGATRWGIFQDAARPGVYLESFLVESWLDHLRQHERMTVTDQDRSAQARSFHIGAEPPVVRHLIAGLPIG
jgi:hypothetical protein